MGIFFSSPLGLLFHIALDLPFFIHYSYG